MNAKKDIGCGIFLTPRNLVHEAGRSYVYARGYSGSTHHDRGYFLHGACGEEVVGSQEIREIFDAFIQGEKILSRTFVFYKKVRRSG